MEFDTNQVNIFVVRTDDSPESAQKVNDIFLRLEQLRIKHLNPVETVNFKVYTPYAEGIKADLYDIEIVPYNDMGVDPKNDGENFRKLDLLGNPDYAEHKMLIIDIDTMPRELAQESIFKSVPHIGETSTDHHGVDELDAATRDMIKEKNLPYIRISSDWMNDNAPTDDVIMFMGGTGHKVYAEYYTNGNPDNLTLGAFITKNWKGVVLNMVPGIFSTYFVGDEERNTSVNDAWASDVVGRYFPKYYEGYGGDENDKYIYFGHEYKTLNFQVKWVKLDESKGISRQDDLYAKCWLL